MAEQQSRVIKDLTSQVWENVGNWEPFGYVGKTAWLEKWG